MALSERERQMLEEMEEAIRAEDPRFASQMNGAKDGTTDRRRIAAGIVGALAGLGLVLLGINTSVWVGVAGFGLIVAAIAVTLAPSRSHGPLGVVTKEGAVKKTSRARTAGLGGGLRKKGSEASAKSPRQGSFMERMEQRWEERRRGGQGW